MTTATPRKRAARKPRAVKEVVDESAASVVDVPAEVVAVEPAAGGSDVEVDSGEAREAQEADEGVLEVEAQRAKYIAKRKLTFKGKEYAAGDPVPGAEEIQRIETWVVHGYLKEA